MKITSFNKILLVAGVIAVLAAGIMLSLKIKHDTIVEPIIVLAFLSPENAADANVIQTWRKIGIAVESVDDCENIKNNQKVSCLGELIDKIASLADSSNAQLVVLGGETYSDSLLRAFEKFNLADQVAGLVFLSAKFDPVIADTIELPKILMISSPLDPAEDVVSRRRMASKLLADNNWVWSTVLSDEGLDHSIAHPVLPEMILYLLERREGVRYLAEFDAESRWQTPLFDNEDYFAVEEAVREYAVDLDLQRILNAFFHHEPYQLKQWPLNTYKSFDLLTYRSLLPVDEQGRYVIFANRKGHRFYLDLDRYGRYLPELVIGVDDELNLYRMFTFYKTKQFYSWEPDGPDEDTLYVQSLGAFIHFRKPLPRQYELPYLQYSTILFDSIAFTDVDPFAGIQNLTHQAYRVLTQNCIPCHSVDGIGGAAYHMDAQSGEPQPGFARPLRTYSKEIYQNFFYNQTATAALIGVNPNYVDREVADELLPWLTENE